MFVKRLVASSVVAMAFAAAAQAPAAARPVDTVNERRAGTVFVSNGDYVHRSGDTASAHGWWTKISGSATRANVTICLQQYRNGGWVNAACNSGTVGSGTGGSANRVTVKKQCGVQLGPALWRSSIDVDIIGEVDSPEVAVTPQQGIACTYA